MLYLQREGYSYLKGFDLSPHAVEICGERGLRVEECDLREMVRRYLPGSADVIISNDTLCFLNEQERSHAMRQFFRVLRPHGLLILNLPALKAFQGIHDLSVGIGHRFSKSDIDTLIAPREFHILRKLYWPFFLSPAIYCVRLRQRMKMRLTRGYEIRSDTDLPSPRLNRILTRITLFENQWLPAKPFGSSLYLVLMKRQG